MNSCSSPNWNAETLAWENNPSPPTAHFLSPQHSTSQPTQPHQNNKANRVSNLPIASFCLRSASVYSISTVCNSSPSQSSMIEVCCTTPRFESIPQSSFSSHPNSKHIPSIPSIPSTSTSLLRVEYKIGCYLISVLHSKLRHISFALRVPSSSFTLIHNAHSLLKHNSITSYYLVVDHRSIHYIAFAADLTSNRQKPLIKCETSATSSWRAPITTPTQQSYPPRRVATPNQ